MQTQMNMKEYIKGNISNHTDYSINDTENNYTLIEGGAGSLTQKMHKNNTTHYQSCGQKKYKPGQKSFLGVKRCTYPLG